MGEGLEETIYGYVKNKQWRKLVNYGGNWNLLDRNQFLWAWPEISDLYFLNGQLKKIGIKHVLSIGCGRGLLEWIINESTGEFFLKSI